MSVKCHLWGGDTTGTAWFDDVSLEFPDEGNPAFERKPLDLRQATVTVDCGRDLGPFRHPWIGSDVGHMDRVVSLTQVNAMRHAHRFGFRYLRMHNCVHNPRIYSENEEGDPVFTWETFDQRIGSTS